MHVKEKNETRFANNMFAYICFFQDFISLQYALNTHFGHISENICYALYFDSPQFENCDGYSFVRIKSWSTKGIP